MGKRARRRQRTKTEARLSLARLWGPTRKITAGGLALIGAFVLLAQAFSPAHDVVSWVSDRFHHRPPPTLAESTIASYVQFTRRAVPWVGRPTVYEPSAEVLTQRFGDFNPYVTHRFKIGGTKERTDIGFLAEHAPQFSGVPLTTEGRFYGTSVVEDRGRVASWQLQLRDPDVQRVGVICRVPASARTGPPFRPGDWVLVQGLLLADGAVQRADGRGMDRILYLACSAVSRRQTIITVTKRGVFAVPGNTPQPTAWLEAHPRAAARYARRRTN